jgi:hypothetical protein
MSVFSACWTRKPLAAFRQQFSQVARIRMRFQIYGTKVALVNSCEQVKTPKDKRAHPLLLPFVRLSYRTSQCANYRGKVRRSAERDSVSKSCEPQ